MKKERTQLIVSDGLDQRGVVIAFLSSIVFAFTGNVNAMSVPENKLKVESRKV